MGLMSRLKAHPRSGSLIDRAIALRDDVPDPLQASAASDIDAGSAVRALLKHLERRTSFGVSSPSQLFTLLHHHLSVERGAILVPESDGDTFVPLATTGLDPTTRIRLRIDAVTLGDLMQPDHVTLIDGADRDRLASYVSRHDLSRSPRIAIFPFRYVGRTTAVLILLDTPFFELDAAVLDVLLAALSDAAGRIFFEERSRFTRATTHRSVFGPEHLPSVRRRIARRAESERRTACEIAISLDPFIEAVGVAHPGIDEAALLEDSLQTTAQFFAPIGIVVREGHRAVRVVSTASADRDPEMLVGLLGATLAQLFVTPPVALAWAVDETERRDADDR